MVREALLEYLASVGKPLDDAHLSGDHQDLHLTVA